MIFKYSLFGILFFILLTQILSLFPNWDLKKSSVDLLSGKDSIIIPIPSQNDFGGNAQIHKEIKKENNKITIRNKLYISDTYIQDVDWEGIESSYDYNEVKYICPKGKFHLHIYSNNKLTEKKPKEFNCNDGWDLSCYKNSDYLYLFYRNKCQRVHAIKFTDSNYDQKRDYLNGMYDYKWTTSNIGDNEYPMKYIGISDGNIQLKGTKCILNDNLDRSDVDSKIIIKAKKYSYAFFDNKNDYFYFMTYNSVYDFQSGYYNDTEEIAYDSLKNLNIIYNLINPLEFIEEVSIDYIKFINGTKYAYYKIDNNKDGTTYHGIIDILLNKVIFNTNEEIKKFIPYLNNSILALTSDSLYKICAISDPNGACIDSCPGNLVISTFNKNYCGECDGILFKPNDICIEECDARLYYQNENECGLCKDINNEDKYKLINSTGCNKNTCPNGSIFYNEDLYLCICDKGNNFYFDGEKCKQGKCHRYCEKCTSYSDKDDDQNCLSCNRSYNLVLEENNCKKSCSKGYFETDKKTCDKCNKSCKTCVQNPNNCSSCEDKKFLDQNNNCSNCSDICEKCSGFADNCQSCNKDSEYKYLLKSNHTCVNICPNDTIIDDKNFICIEPNSSHIDPSGGDNNTKQPNFILWSFIILMLIFIFIISICICKKYCNKKTDNNNLIDNINNELEEKESINN